MKIKDIGYKTDIGKIREHNEDYLIVDKTISLFIIGDGMGGRQGGEVASEVGVKTICSFIRDSVRANNDNIPSIIHQAFHVANRIIYTKAFQEPDLNGMGTTIVLALCHNDKIYIAHVGDSRAYLIQNEKIKQLTQDHSITGELLKAGKITEEEANKHHLRNFLTKALGTKEIVKPDIISISLQEGDLILLCTDGLTDMLKNKEIKDIILNSNNPQKTCEKLIFTANKNGGKDNTTIILIKFE